ncbi:homeobox protein HOX1A-like [Miscanthus floridulus]|uniref:homeobox protein HOX1A-like n=1 Tax=Miscanthus floridulus TaxID=154761 RepID=UPI003459DBF7
MEKNTAHCPVEGNGKIENGASSSQNPENLEHPVLLSTSQPVPNNLGIRKNYKRAANRGKKGSQGLIGQAYTLRSSDNDVRVLRSTSSSKMTPTEHVQTPVQPAAKRRKKSRASNKSSTDEFSQIRKRVRYILNRMNYEQSLIEAYASEGWKNQSLDKIRPEKELERAKSEILRCKLRIREVFQNIDSLLSKGKIDESLFDSEGEISCEDIFCATCGSKDSTLGNDIILCDGACDRGFHQNCLNPPLRTEDIPMGDEGWLCPACDCKIDCIDLINDLQGSDLSIEDSWEKVFPEAAAMANGSKQDDAFDLPSDDSDDNDFDPNMPEEHVVSKEEGSSEDEEDEDGGSDSDDSDFLTCSDDSEPLMDKKKVDDLGLPSEDSEDDDYDPAGPDSNEDVEKKSSSDESDFSSDSDDFCKEIAKSGGHDEVSSPPLPDDKVGDMEKNTAQANTASSADDPMETEIDQSVVLPVSRRRQAERLDYKKLYDEAYGEASSDSSDDEEWSGKNTPIKSNEEGEADSPAGKGSRVVHHNNGLTTQSTKKSLHSLHGSVDEKHGDLTSNGSNSTARKGHFGPVVNQKLHEHFKTQQYPSRSVKESLAEELGLTFRQVSKWFESRRHFAKVASSRKGISPDKHCPENTNSPVTPSVQPKEPEWTVMEESNVSINRDATISKKAVSSKVGSRKNLGKNFPGSDVGGSKVDSAKDQNPGPDLAEKARQKAVQQELKKKKMGR